MLLMLLTQFLGRLSFKTFVVLRIHLPCSFLLCGAPLYFSHASRVGDVTVISSAEGTQQGDPLGDLLFALAYYRALCSTATTFSSCLFPSIADDTYIMEPASEVVPAFLHFSAQLSSIGLTVNKDKCLAWCPKGLPADIFLFEGFFTPQLGIKALGVSTGSFGYVNSFMREALDGFA
ncbi:hypothetical protein O6H91_10G017800 [Diphasiastrum complanatum]|uniref:Uncharacterized protein n=1 Tax=Diphasiastrum complanatum TaxID=34168 RepID=A0ACC2CEM2_DIPCM|nr:hypothetical protein O6H91_10G017800 [Diphasiastrum complanatum]